MSQKVYYPLTSPQLSIWYTEQMFSGTSISNVAGTLRIQENVDFVLLEKAIQLFIQNNDGIRLRLCLDENGSPQQYLSEYVETPIPFMDFTVYADPAKAFYDWNSERTLQPFELLDSALFSFTMVKISDSDGGFYIITHHAVSDAWNMALIGSFIVDYYCKLKIKITDEAAFPPKPSYLSFIENDISYKQSNRYEKDKLFWEQQFDLIPEATVLKTRKIISNTAKSKRKTFVAPVKFTHKLKEYCRENKITPYPLFLAALCTYIFRVTAKEDLVLGTPILNRLNHADKNTSGMFISTIPLRIGLNPEESFSGLCERILEIASAAYRHQRFPYDQILRYVREKHDIRENLFDMVLSYQNTKFDKSYEVDYITRWHFNGYQPNSLTVHVNDRDDEGAVIIDYDYHENLYYDTEIEFLHHHLLSLLWHALDNPQKAICKIEMLQESEKRKVLYEFNNTEMDYPREKLIHQLFEEQVERTPDHGAIVFEEKTMTYRELNERANQLAAVLRHQGVKRDDIVGIMVPRSFELIIGILAILKAGGAFMTMEPDFPAERIRYMLENSNVSILLTSGGFVDHVQVEQCNIFNETIFQHESKKNLEHVNTSRDLAYVIYTSGTTGFPKGVMIEHQSLHNFVCSLTKEFSYGQSSTVLSVASICFDLFIMEFMPAILSGAKLILANRNQQNLPFMISRLIIENSVTDILFTPSRMKLFVDDEAHYSCLLNIEHIMLGGEKLEPQLVRKLKQLTNALILNAYGPTETTIAATFKRITEHDKITIGKPISNSKVFILDRFHNPVPINVQGELYISDECLARGYVNNPELTSMMFTDSPFSRMNKLYKTGDLARWYPKGDIEFLGRKDNQVKFRGYRIELSEIENTLLKYPGIEDVAVNIKQINTQDSLLCAYYVSKMKVEPKQLKRYLRNNMPQYMLPQYLTQIDYIPLNSSGKKDLKQLPDIYTVFEDEESCIKPENEMEEKLLKIITSFMNDKNISVISNLFEVGFDSLGVIKLVSFMDKEGYQISIEDIYKCTSIRELSKIIDKKAKKAIEQITPRMSPFKEIPHIDSAAITYIPHQFSVTLNDSEPIFLCSIQTRIGTIGLFVMPIMEKQLINEKNKLIELCYKTIQQANHFGAQVVSLTGILPAVTNFGSDIIQTYGNMNQVTTGQATTTASILLNLEKLLLLSNSNVFNEKISILGLDDIGMSFAELLLYVYPDIKNITLCNTSIRNVNEEVFNIKKHYRGNIELIESSDGHLPSEIYNSSVIVGVSNIPNVIDVDLLKPGTILIDYSIPHSLSKERAIARLEKKCDILFSDGGTLCTSEPMQKDFYISDIEVAQLKQIYHHLANDRQVTACILSGLLITRSNKLRIIQKQVHLQDSLSHYEALKEYQFSSAILQFDDYIIGKEQVSNFLKSFGRSVMPIE